MREEGPVSKATPEGGREAKKYSTVKTRIFVADLIVTACSLFIFQIFISRPVNNSVGVIFPNFYLACFAYLAVFFAFMCAVGFPLRFFSSFFVEHRFGLSNQRFVSWFIDEIKSGALVFVIFIAGGEVFYLILRRYPAGWWAITALIWIFFSIIIARLVPVIVIPLFFKYIPIMDRALKERILALGQKAGISIMDVCQIDLSRKTKKANAALIGLGKTRKVILADTLTSGFTPEEVEAVVAHEFAHHKYRHIWQLIIFSGFVTMTGFFLFSRVFGRIAVFAGAFGVSDLFIFPILIFLIMCFSMVILPLQNLFSRALEKQADSFALDIIGLPETFISVMKKLASMNLADTEPSFLRKIFLYDHPPIKERISMAENWNKSNGAHAKK